MPRRFTDTEKWKDGWYLSLNNDTRIVWQFVLDTCTIAGRWKKNFKLLNFCCNVELNDSVFKEKFNGRVIEYDDFYLIPKFVKYQYPKGLSSNKPAVRAIVNELCSCGLVGDLLQSLGNDYLIVKDKDIDKDKDKDTDKDSRGGAGGSKPGVIHRQTSKRQSKCTFCGKEISEGVICKKCSDGYNNRGAK